jgi:biopolymer transport protein ExbD
MAANRANNLSYVSDDDAPVIRRQKVKDSADMDITPMIDITFLLLIFFLVSSTQDNKTSVDLAGARHGTGVNHRNAVIVTLTERGSPGRALVYLADGCVGDPLPDDPELQRQQIVEAVRHGVDTNKTAVLLKAAKGVKHREVARVSAAASEVEGISLYLAVFETD